MSEPFMGEIKMVPWNYPPRYWAFCDGATLAINTNQALFSLLGTAYGGNGVTTFNLPNLQSRTPMGAEGAGAVGAIGGVPNYTLNPNEVAQHNHQVTVAGVDGNSATFVAGGFLGQLASGYGKKNANQVTTLQPLTVSKAGANAPHENRQPFLAINFVIALSGIFPSRN